MYFSAVILHHILLWESAVCRYDVTGLECSEACVEWSGKDHARTSSSKTDRRRQWPRG